jgi:hypothetical protein
MTLFDARERTECRVKHYSEPEFEYLSQSARPAAVALRRLLEEWFQDYPSDAQTDLRSRFRSDDYQYAAAFFELYLHALLRALGYSIAVHPLLPDSSAHPDFLIHDADGCEFYVEATLAGLPSKREQGASARVGQVYDVLNRMDSPNFFLHIQVRGAPLTPPPARKLSVDVERWLRSLDVDMVSNLGQAGSLEVFPKLTWSYDGWEVVFTPIAKSPAARGKTGLRPIGMHVPEVQWLQTDVDLRTALEAKAKKYGALQLPLLLAVNVLSAHCDNYDILNAFFGQESTTISFQQDGSIADEYSARRGNGFWFGPQGPRNQRVSAALIAAGLNGWNMGNLIPELFHNPWASMSLNPDCWQLPQNIPNTSTNQYDRSVGKTAREILAIPDPWPISWD